MSRCSCCNGGSTPCKYVIVFRLYVATSRLATMGSTPCSSIVECECAERFISDKYEYDTSLAGCATTPLPYLPYVNPIEYLCVDESKKDLLNLDYSGCSNYITPIIDSLKVYINDEIEIDDNLLYIAIAGRNYETYKRRCRHEYGDSAYDYIRGSYIFGTAKIINPFTGNSFIDSFTTDGTFGYTSLGDIGHIFLTRDEIISGEVTFLNDNDNVYSPFYGPTRCGESITLGLCPGQYVKRTKFDCDLSQLSNEGPEPHVYIYPILVGYEGSAASISGGGTDTALITMDHNTTTTISAVNVTAIDIIKEFLDNLKTSIPYELSDSYISGTCRPRSLYTVYDIEDYNCSTRDFVTTKHCGRQPYPVGYKKYSRSIAPKLTADIHIKRIYRKLSFWGDVKEIILPLVPVNTHFRFPDYHYSIEGSLEFSSAISGSAGTFAVGQIIDICDAFGNDLSSTLGDISVQCDTNSGIIGNAFTVGNARLVDPSILYTPCTSSLVITRDSIPDDCVGIFYTTEGSIRFPSILGIQTSYDQCFTDIVFESSRGNMRIVTTTIVNRITTDLSGYYLDTEEVYVNGVLAPGMTVSDVVNARIQSDFIFLVGTFKS